MVLLFRIIITVCDGFSRFFSAVTMGRDYAVSLNPTSLGSNLRPFHIEGPARPAAKGQEIFSFVLLLSFSCPARTPSLLLFPPTQKGHNSV